MCIGLIPILGIFALPCAALAIVFGIVGIVRRSKRGFAITGVVTGLLGLALAVAGLVIVNGAVNDLSDCSKAISADIEHSTNTADAICG